MNWTSRAFMVAAVLLCIGLPLLMDNIKLANDPQLKILRELMPYWDRTESGGIVLLAEPPKEHAQAVYRTLVDSPADASADSKLDDKWSRQLPSLTDKLARFFQAARLEPGTYTFANPYYQLLKNGELKGNSIPMNSDGDNPMIAIPQTESVTFTVTPDHVKLLRHMNTRSYGN
ncbi:MAG: hypothetical protein JO170_20695 [Verrucomicrobia bacterium]|nr:hypothetical protein [Verrucomicrobiota bacterium]